MSCSTKRASCPRRCRSPRRGRSGLPWGSLPAGVADSILNAVFASLEPGGTFVTFGYVHSQMLPGIRRFRNRVVRHFASVSTSPVIWNNVPPAVVVRCK